MPTICAALFNAHVANLNIIEINSVNIQMVASNYLGIVLTSQSKNVFLVEESAFNWVTFAFNIANIDSLIICYFFC